jgi:hypothetical protein
MRLIAAAPELLEALRRVDAQGLSEFPGGPDDPFTIAGCEPDAVAMWRVVRAAIAKAEGQEVPA